MPSAAAILLLLVRIREKCTIELRLPIRRATHMIPPRAAVAFSASTLLAFVICACGSNSGSNGGSSGGSSGGTTTVNPCLSASLEDQAEPPLTGTVASGEVAQATDKKILIDGDPRGRVLEALWLHQAAQQQRERGGRAASTAEGAPGSSSAATSPGPVAADVGDVAVLQDQGDLVLPANNIDIRGSGLRFTRSGSGYSISKIDGDFRSTLGRQLTLQDDDSAQVSVPFSFSFFDTAQTSAFVNSDGNVTFGEEDRASTERNISRLITGPPRVSPFLADLDPSSGGEVFVNATSDQYTVTWCAVKGFDSTKTVTVQTTLLPNGTIEMKYGDTFTLTDAVVGLSPGKTGQFQPIDLSTTTPSSAGNVAMGERFAASGTLDTVAASKTFLSSHPDAFDQVILWTDQPLLEGGTFAYETTVANEIRGIGQDVYDLSNEFGSSGRLRSIVVMDWLGKYPDDPNQKFLGENNTLSVLGQEVGHRWLAYIDIRDHTGAKSDVLLGRDKAHWSFFFDSDASVMEGNDIEDLGGGQFRTIDAVKRYSRLDQYIMGLVPQSAVPPFFYVENPTGTTKEAASAPHIGDTFTGTRRDVLIEDVIAANGQRNPSSDSAPRTFHQAFVYVVTAGRSTDSSQVSKVDNIRRQWESFFHSATENRMTPNVSLR
jgi:hypothetical protein